MECICVANARHKVIIFVNPVNLIGNSEDNNNKANPAESNHHDYKTTMTHNSRGHLLLKLPAHYNNKYEVFYSLWPCLFIPSLNLVAIGCIWFAS